MWHGGTRYGASILLFALTLGAPAARADPQSVADFYRGKTLTISVGLSAGGGYDLHARLLAKYFGRHLPGTPTVVVKNAPGAGSLTLVNASMRHCRATAPSLRPSSAAVSHRAH